MAPRRRKPNANQGYTWRGEKGVDGKRSCELYVLIGYKDAAKTKKNRKFRTVRCRNDAEAQQELNKFALAVHSDNYIRPEAKTLSKFFVEYIETYAKRTMKPSSVKNHLDIWKDHIEPKLGHLQMKDLKPLIMKDFIAQLADHLAPASKRKIYNNLNSILNRAAKWQVIAKNPLDGIDPPKLIKKKVQVYDENQLDIFLDALELAPMHWKMFYLFALETGCRTGEIIAMTWDKVNYINNEVEISANAYYDNGMKISTTKNEKERLIAINPDFMQALRAWEIELGKIRDKAGEVWEESRRFLFPNLSTGNMLNKHSPRTWLNKFRDKHNLDKITPHGFRHIHASYLLMRGESEKVVGERMGHSRTSVTTDTYGHVTRKADHTAATQMRNVYSLEKVLGK